MKDKDLLDKLEDEIQNKLGYYGLLMFHYEMIDDKPKAEIMRKEIECVAAYHAHIVNIIKSHMGDMT